MPDARSLRNVNILYLIAMLLIVTVGSAMQSLAVGPGLIGTEVLLILLPALVYVRFVDSGAKERLRLRWPGAKFVIAGLLVGVGLQGVSIVLNAIVVQAFGYSVGLPPSYYPTTTAQAVLLFIALAIAAPLCEEFLFRGVIQPAYESHMPRGGILVAGLLFALFHLRFQGLIPLLPIAFVLGYVVWRSDSLVTGMVTHFAFNAANVGMTIVYAGHPERLVEFILPAIAIGLVGAVVGFSLLASAKKDSTVESEPRESQPGRRTQFGKLATGWPLVIAAVIYVIVARQELTMFANVGTRVQQPVSLQADAPIAPATWVYEIQDPLGQPVGTAEYHLEQAGNSLTLTWTAQHDAFRTEVGANSVYQSGAVESSGRAEWRMPALDLVALHAQSNDLVWMLSDEAGEPRFSVSHGEHPHPNLGVLPSTIAQGEWPWRLSYLPFAVGYRAVVPVAWPLKWNPATETSEPLLELIQLRIPGGVPMETPAGRFAVWRVEVGDRDVVWYDAKPPHAVIRYHDGVVNYVLLELR